MAFWRHALFCWLTMSRVLVTVEKWMMGWSHFPDWEKVFDWRTTKILFVLLPDGLREVDGPWPGAASPEVYGKNKLFLDNAITPQIIGTRRGRPSLHFGSGSAWHCSSSGWQRSDNTGQTLGECCGMAHCEEGSTADAAERRAATAGCLCIYWYCTVKNIHADLMIKKQKHTCQRDSFALPQRTTTYFQLTYCKWKQINSGNAERERLEGGGIVREWFKSMTQKMHPKW